jgi:hypothetical protein
MKTCPINPLKIALFFTGLMLTVLGGSLLLSIFPAPALAQDVWFDGYQRSDGAYVPGHYRSRPDQNPYNHYSTDGNWNPYTGQRGSSPPQNLLQNPASFGRSGSPSPVYGNGNIYRRFGN